MTEIEAFGLLRSAAGMKGKYEYGERKLAAAVELSEDIRTALQTMASAGALPYLRVNNQYSNADALPLTGEAQFEALAPKAYFENLAELIKRHPISPPPDFRIFDIQDDEKRTRYLQASMLAVLLGDLAATKTNKDCVIFATDKLEIPFEYSEGDLREIPALPRINILMAPPAANDPDSTRLFEIHRTLFRQALYDVLGKVTRVQRFSHLIQHFDECVFRYHLAFRRFSEEANTVIERYEEKRAGMISALNGVLGNIQTSLIGIPLAGLLALKEMKPSEGLTFFNIVIAAASVIVAVLLFLLSVSQGKTLEAIDNQYQQLKKEIDDSGGGTTKIGTALQSMASHQQLVRKLLILVRAVIVIFAFVALGALFVSYSRGKEQATVTTKPAQTEANFNLGK